jgi:hypothetical protein
MEEQLAKGAVTPRLRSREQDGSHGQGFAHASWRRDAAGPA